MAPGDPEVERLERQLERASLYSHAVFDKLVERMSSVEGFLWELVDLLRSEGVVPASEEAVGEPAEGEQAEKAPTQTRQLPWPSIAFREDPEDPQPPAEVNCAERMHICHAVCCRLNFALSPEEVDAGAVKWDLGSPYFIRHEKNGYCTHNDETTGGCGVYADRPGVCRRYSCAGDSRIWKDFEGMVLNQEWIDQNLEDNGRIFLGPLRPKMELVAQRARAE
jgi:Fe-S-cluster containining protein